MGNLGYENLDSSRRFESLVGNIRIKKIEAKFDRSTFSRTLKGSETESIKMPKFILQSIVRVPELLEDENYHLGFIQCVYESDSRYYYSDIGCKKTVLDKLEINEWPMICDANETPFISKLPRVFYDINGPVEDKDYFLAMNDSCSSTYSLAREHGSENLPLTNVVKFVKFFTWIVFHDPKTHHFGIIRSVKWEVGLDYEPEKEKLMIMCPKPESPKNIRISNVGFFPTTPNHIQEIVWIPLKNLGAITIDSSPYTKSLDRFKSPPL